MVHSFITSYRFVRLVATIHTFAHDRTCVWSRPNNCMVTTKQLYAHDQTLVCSRANQWNEHTNV